MGKKRPRVFRLARPTLAELFDRGVSVDEAAAMLQQSPAAVRSMFRMIASRKGQVMAEDAEDSEMSSYLLRLPVELHEWFKVEAKNSGRSLRWLMCNALEQYRRRLENGRK